METRKLPDDIVAFQFFIDKYNENPSHEYYHEIERRHRVVVLPGGEWTVEEFFAIPQFMFRYNKYIEVKDTDWIVYAEGRPKHAIAIVMKEYFDKQFEEAGS